MERLKPYALKSGSTLGIFTSSWPGHVSQREKFDLALTHLHELGFKTKLGSVTARFKRQGYRTADGKTRAQELMDLLTDPEVDGVIATLGGSVTNSLLEHLDYAMIRKLRKPVIGHSDLTSLLMAIHEKAGLVTFYGPMVVPSLGEYPKPLDLTVRSFLRSVRDTENVGFELEVPEQWSDEEREATSPNWKEGERSYKKNPGWRMLNPGESSGLNLAANLNTLCNCLGTPYVPSFKGKILFIEQLEMDLSKEERQLSQLRLAGVFDEISGLVVSKPEIYNQAGAEFTGADLYREIIGPRKYPVVWDFDCGHTYPSHTIPIGVRVSVQAGEAVKIRIEEAAVERPQI